MLVEHSHLVGHADVILNLFQDHSASQPQLASSGGGGTPTTGFIGLS